MRRFPLIALVLLVPGLASAHAVLLDPMPRNPNDFNKDETLPCGATTPRSSNPSVFAPGQTITVRWQETVEHPGHYELSLSMANDQNFTAVAANIADVGGASAGAPNQYQQQITLPDTECETCTLRMIQVMSDNNDTEYFSCADIAIRAGAGEDAGPGADGGPEADASPGQVGIGDPPGLCAVAPGRHRAPWSAVWLGAAITLMGVTWRRNRRK